MQQLRIYWPENAVFQDDPSSRQDHDINNSNTETKTLMGLMLTGKDEIIIAPPLAQGASTTTAYPIGEISFSDKSLRMKRSRTSRSSSTLNIKGGWIQLVQVDGPHELPQITCISYHNSSRPLAFTIQWICYDWKEGPYQLPPSSSLENNHEQLRHHPHESYEQFKQINRILPLPSQQPVERTSTWKTYQIVTLVLYLFRFVRRVLEWEIIRPSRIVIPLLPYSPSTTITLKDLFLSMEILDQRLSQCIHMLGPEEEEEAKANTTKECGWILLIDIFLGIGFALALETCLLPYVKDVDFGSLLSVQLRQLNHQIEWLMEDAPAGLKLNQALTAILGNGALIITDSWNYVTRDVIFACLPIISIEMLKKISFLGMTMPLALLFDLVNYFTQHTIYLHRYFSKLHHFELALLSSLWKLFLGRKNNVLRHRVDHCAYDMNQLLIGTLLFTIFVFLLTTISVFYVFFAIIRILIISIQGICFILPIFLIQAFPIHAMVKKWLHMDSTGGGISWEWFAIPTTATGAATKDPWYSCHLDQGEPMIIRVRSPVLRIRRKARAWSSVFHGYSMKLQKVFDVFPPGQLFLILLNGTIVKGSSNAANHKNSFLFTLFIKSMNSSESEAPPSSRSSKPNNTNTEKEKKQ